MSTKSEVDTAFDRYFGDRRYFLRDMATASIGWYKTEVLQLRRKRFNKRHFIMAEGDMVRKRVMIGQMFMFGYFPKYHETLPVWDKYPLVIPFRRTDNGFIGINFHYLPYKARAWLLWKLEKAFNLKASEGKKMRVTYQLLEGFSRVPLAEYAVHRYLSDHILTPYKLIEVYDYPRAIMLPIQQFYGEDANKFKKLI